MITADHVNKIFERGWWVIQRQTDGVSHQESLLQPEFRANCMNWVLGHLLYERQLVLELLGVDLYPGKQITRRYAYDSEPITAESEGIIELGEMLAYLEEAGNRMAEGFTALEQSQWESEIDDEGTKMWERLEFLAWHEGYHVGQLELLRQLAGKNDKVI
jgi:hypothetical protein